MLDGPRTKFGLPPISGPNEPWVVLMDWGVNNGMATVVAASDGSASVYFASGGGVHRRKRSGVHSRGCTTSLRMTS